MESVYRNQYNLIVCFDDKEYEMESVKVKQEAGM